MFEHAEKSRKEKQAECNRRMRSEPSWSALLKAKIEKENEALKALTAARNKFKKTNCLDAEFGKHIKGKTLSHYFSMKRALKSISSYLSKERRFGFILNEPYDTLKAALETALDSYLKHLESIYRNPAETLSVAPSKPERKRLEREAKRGEGIINYIFGNTAQEQAKK